MEVPFSDAPRAKADPTPSPLLTLEVHDVLLSAARSGLANVQCSLDLGRTTATVEPGPADWAWNRTRFPYLDTCRERTIYFWATDRFQPAARFGTSLAKLVPTEWGPPTFELDGIKMLPTLRVSPFADAERKVALVRPRGKVILDTCGGLGYFAACCLKAGASRVLSFEKNPDVMWLRELNPWSPKPNPALQLAQGDVVREIAALPDASCAAILHDPPRFGIAGELYSQDFYNQLARVLQRGGLMFHYTGTPNKLTSGRDVPNEVAERLRQAGFATQPNGDGILAARQSAVRMRGR